MSKENWFMNLDHVRKKVVGVCLYVERV